MNQLPSDLRVLVLGQFNMYQQLGLSRVCQMWKRLIDFHPLLLNMLDFGDPALPKESGVVALFKKSGSRIRHLRLWVHRHPNYWLLKEISNALPYLRQLSLVGHARPMSEWILDHYLTHQREFHVILRFESCSCCLDEFRWDLAKAASSRPNTIEMQSDLCQAPCEKKCHQCQVPDRWLRLCPCCSLDFCSACNTWWRWSNEYKTSFPGDQCTCKICHERTLHPLTAQPPLWTSSL